MFGVGGINMLSYIKRYEPPRRRLRIRNKIIFTVSLILILLALSAILIPKKGTSQVSYKPYKVGYGDTYWQIAKDLQAAGYRSRTDIRDIVHELIQKSGIMAHELKEGDTIYIPELGVEK
jgi:hypothetical protein